MPALTTAESAAEPPLADSYLDLLRGGGIAPPTEGCGVQERELPLIDLSCLTSGRGSASAREARRACADAMARAASEWGFFQVTGHGVSRALLERLRAEQARLFRLPFETKAKAGLLNGSYRWGAPTATSLRHLSWSEAFHVPLASISGTASCDFGDLSSLRYAARLLCPVLYLHGLYIC
jgi:gibberellin 2-oxidase